MFRSIAFNTIVSSGGRVIGSILALASFAFIARSLGQEGLGEYSTAMAFGFIFSAIADLGLFQVLVREISKPGANEKYITSNIFTLRILSLVFFLSLAPASSLFFRGYSGEVKIAIAIASLTYFFLGVNQLLLGVFQKYLRLDKAAMAEVVSRIIQLGLVFLFFKLNLGLFMFLGAAASGSFINFILAFIFSRKLIPISFDFDFKFWQKILKTAFPIGISLVFTLIYFKIDTILLSIFKTQEDVGIYNVAYKFLESIIFFPAMFAGIIMPFLSRYAIENIEKFKETFQKSFDILVIFALPLVFGGWFVAKDIAVLLGGENFIGSQEPLRLLLIACGFIFLGNLLGRSVIALNLQKKAIWAYFLGMILNIILNIILIPRWSYNGAAVTTIFTEFFVTGCLFFIIFKQIKYFPRLGKLLKAFLATLVMVLPFYFWAQVDTFILVFIATLVYFGFLYLIKGIDKKEYSFLLERR